MTIIATSQMRGSYAVTWECHGRYGQGQTHTVTYGFNEYTFSGDLAAPHVFGECVRRAAKCAGLFD